MPKSRSKNNSSKNAAATSTASVPLLDSMRADQQSSIKPKNDSKSDVDSSKLSASGWQCNVDDWSDERGLDREADGFPPTLRSIERKTQQAKDNFFLLPRKLASENENKPDLKEQINDRTKATSFHNVDISKLSSIVTNLIAGECDEVAYADFLSILQYFSVHSTRDDHLEETVYHLIQAAVSFIRSNEERFDPSKLQECYYQRHILKTNFTQ